MSIVWKNDVQLPWYGLLFAFFLPWLVILPIGVIQATTNQQPGYDIIAQFIVGYILLGNPLQICFSKYTGKSAPFMLSLSYLTLNWATTCRFRHAPCSQPS